MSRSTVGGASDSMERPELGFLVGGASPCLAVPRSASKGTRGHQPKPCLRASHGAQGGMGGFFDEEARARMTSRTSAPPPLPLPLASLPLDAPSRPQAVAAVGASGTSPSRALVERRTADQAVLGGGCSHQHCGVLSPLHRRQLQNTTATCAPWVPG